MLNKLPDDLPDLFGISCTLKPLSLDEVTNDYIGWLNDKSINRFLESRFDSHSYETTMIYVESQIKSGANLFYGIWSLDHKHIGNIKLGPVDFNHYVGDIGFLIGNASYQNKGIATEAIKLLTNYGFSIGIEKITAGAYEPNVGSIKALEKSGFQREGCRKNQVLLNGRRIDTILFGLQCPSIVNL